MGVRLVCFVCLFLFSFAKCFETQTSRARVIERLEIHTTYSSDPAEGHGDKEREKNKSKGGKEKLKRKSLVDLGQRVVSGRGIPGYYM